MKFIKIYNTPILLIVLVLSLSTLAFYNYHSQKNLLLKQMRSDAEDTVSSITAAMDRFNHIKSTMNMQRLVSEVSFGLEIFEFRYLEPDGIIQESMFKKEIGKIYDAKSFRATMLGDKELGAFFFEERDYVPVMAIYYPIYAKGNLIGIIDLAVDISEYDVIDGAKQNFSLMRRQVDIMNLLKSIEGSIRNSLKIFEEADLYDFLYYYVKMAENIVQISIVDGDGKIFTSSNQSVIGNKIPLNDLEKPGLLDTNGQLLYQMISGEHTFHDNKNGKLLMLIDADPYLQNEQLLLHTALFTGAVAILFALLISRGIYFSALERSREEQKRLEKLVKERTLEIELLSKTDALTGLWNRSYLDEMMEMEFKRARRYSHDIAIIIIDFDHFKKINDTYGHVVGDDVLRNISSRIKTATRDTDFVGRYGGEEIVVILPESSSQTACKVAEHIREKIAEEPVVSGETSINVTASIGVSNLNDRHEALEDVFVEADRALYAAKASGRNRVNLFQG